MTFSVSIHRCCMYLVSNTQKLHLKVHFYFPQFFRSFFCSYIDPKNILNHNMCKKYLDKNDSPSPSRFNVVMFGVGGCLANVPHLCRDEPGTRGWRILHNADTRDISIYYLHRYLLFISLEDTLFMSCHIYAGCCSVTRPRCSTAHCTPHWLQMHHLHTPDSSQAQPAQPSSASPAQPSKYSRVDA